MKTKKILQSLVVVAAMGMIFSGCKKDDPSSPATTPPSNVSTTPTPADAAKRTQNASDQSNMETQSDQSMDDINSIIENNSALRGISGPCNVTIDSSQKSIGKITLTYNGLSCDLSKNLSGSISIQLPYISGQLTGWSDTGATMSITYTNFKVKNVLDTSSIEFNGTCSVTNVTGGNVFTVASGDSVVHQIRGNMAITFTDTATVTRNCVARTRTFYKQSGLLSIFGSLSTKLTGDTTINGNSNVSVWGTNRAGEAFSVAITTPILVNISGSVCLFRPTGVKVYRKGTDALTITYGVDISGNPVSAGTCPYGYKLNWNDSSGSAKEVIRMYLF